MSEWISTAEAADLLGISVRQVQRSLEDDMREQEWGAEGEGWRRKPLSQRTRQLSREAVERKLKPGA